VATQVAIVGAGPVGLMLAGCLRLGGAEVIVFEQLAEATTESRASTLHARTMEILDSLGLLEAFGSPPREPRGHFGGMPLDLDLPSPSSGQWKVPQTRTEALLHAWASGLGAEIRRGHCLYGLRQSPEGVEAELDGPDAHVLVRCDHLVGCDGEESTVRALLNADFPGQDAERQLLRADVAGIDVPARRFERLERGMAVAARRADGVTRIMVHEFGAPAKPEAPDFDAIAHAWKRVTGEDVSAGKPLWVNAFDDTNRQLAQYRHGRVLFAGDAAHRQMPIGGQALNLGLQDAVNLGWKLAAQVAGTAAVGLLDTYHTERHAVGARVLGNIRAQARLLLGGAESNPMRALLGELIGLEDVRRHLAGMISGLDVRYDVGAVGHPLLGARLPLLRLSLADGPATSARLLRSGRGVLLDLRGPESLACTFALPWADRVLAVEATPAPEDAELTQGAEALLIRPDGHVVWVGRNLDGLREALSRWFGPARAA
jgi:2-polyprenyl-6-methoxyphenol hydroxylase-like FAD-dependent oxidoreductase